MVAQRCGDDFVSASCRQRFPADTTSAHQFLERFSRGSSFHQVGTGIERVDQRRVVETRRLLSCRSCAFAMPVDHATQHRSALHRGVDSAC